MKQKIGNFLGVAGATVALTALILGSPVGILGIGVLLFLAGLATRFTKTSVVVALAVVTAGCSIAQAEKPQWFRDQEKVSDHIAIAATKAVPYPAAAVEAGGFLERKQQVEKLKRFSDPNHNGFVYIMSFGKFIGYYPITGKVSSVNSSLTNTTQTWDMGSDGGDFGVDSIGDDGTFGTNEGGDAGVFFVTTGGALIVTTLEWLYTDKPISVGDVPQLAG
jgi:hypothetical protein